MVGGIYPPCFFVVKNGFLTNYLPHGNIKICCNLLLQLSALLYGNPVVTTKYFFCIKIKSCESCHNFKTYLKCSKQLFFLI